MATVYRPYALAEWLLAFGPLIHKFGQPWPAVAYRGWLLLAVVGCGWPWLAGKQPRLSLARFGSSRALWTFGCRPRK